MLTLQTHPFGLCLLLLARRLTVQTRASQLSQEPSALAPVLVSAGIELFLFLVAGTVLCFGFSGRIMLIL